MKTKLVKFEPPKESTIYNPPLKMVNEVNREYDLLAYVVDSEFPFAFKQNSFRSSEVFRVIVPDKPQRMTCLQVMQLMDKGGWIAKTVNDEVVGSLRIDASELLEIVGSKVKVSRIDKIEWIEPTTDLL